MAERLGASIIMSIPKKPNNPKQGPFDSSYDLNKIPSYQSRFASMDSLVGEKIDMQNCNEKEREGFYKTDEHEKLRAKLGSGQDIRTNPSIILRRKGVRV